MTKEFNLSEKIGTFVYHGDEGTSGYCDAVIVENVKEFIKRLKDKTALRKDQNDGRKEALIIQEVIMEIEGDIDKLAGDKLNGRI